MVKTNSSQESERIALIATHIINDHGVDPLIPALPMFGDMSPFSCGIPNPTYQDLFSAHLTDPEHMLKQATQNRVPFIS